MDQVESGVTRVQQLILENFPRPDSARTLSPTGRAHWAAQRKARLHVADVVIVQAIRMGLKRMRGQVMLQMTYVMPNERARDQDNYSGSGVTKAVIDVLVKGGWLDGDDTARLRLAPVQIRVEKGRRALKLRFEEGENEWSAEF
jgi:hypothetical protein